MNTDPSIRDNTIRHEPISVTSETDPKQITPALKQKTNFSIKNAFASVGNFFNKLSSSMNKTAAKEQQEMTMNRLNPQ